MNRENRQIFNAKQYLDTIYFLNGYYDSIKTSTAKPDKNFIDTMILERNFRHI